MVSRNSFAVVVVGGGPRGTSVLERILAQLLAQPADLRPRLSITLLEPYEPGAGHVWQTGQSRLYLMNTPSLYPTVVPAGLTGRQLTGSPVSLSFDEWRRAAAADELADADLDAGDRAELKELDSAGFPSRAVYGRYLRWIYRRTAEALAAVAELTHVRATAESVTRTADGYTVFLAAPAGDAAGPDTPRQLTADAVVLALGHVPARLNAGQDRLARAAAELGLHYQGPNVPGDVDWSELAAGENVLVRGLGLNFFDVMIQLTQGRGGVFQPTGDAPGRSLSYHPSGTEPTIFAASRRGTPYRAKALLTSYLPASVRLRFLTRPALARLAEESRDPGRGRLGFAHDIWPLLHRDILWAYYSTLARVSPGLFSDGAEDFLARLETTLGETHEVGREVWQRRVQALLASAAPEAEWLDVEALRQPFQHRGFESGVEYQRAVLEYLESDAAGSAEGEDNPLKMAIGALNAGRSLVKELAADGALSDCSWLEDLRTWFEPLVEGLASGPPLLRIEQLAALARAGVVRFLGPDPEFAVDSKAGCFTASSPWVAGMQVSARQLVEAMMPANRVQRTLSPVLAGLLADGSARPRTFTDADGAAVPGQGLDVTSGPHRLIRADGTAPDNIFVLGLQLSSVQWGTAIAAEAGAEATAGARTLADAEAIAAELVSLARARK